MLATEREQLVASAMLFEGEGSIVVYHDKRRGNRSPVMHVTMTDKEPVEWFASVWGGSARGPYFRKDKPKDKATYRWQTGSWPNVERIALAIRPFVFSRRREQIDSVLAEFPAHLRGKEPRVNGLLCPTEVIPSKSGYMRHYLRGQAACEMCLASYAMWERLHRSSRSKLTKPGTDPILPSK